VQLKANNIVESALEGSVVLEINHILNESEFHHMTDKPIAWMEQFQAPVVRAYPEKVTESQQIESVGRINPLQATLNRFIPPQNSEPIEFTTCSQDGMEKVGDKIRRAFTFRYSQNTWNQLKNWENEGGEINHASA
jgi:hypothetical protein